MHQSPVPLNTAGISVFAHSYKPLSRQHFAQKLLALSQGHTTSVSVAVSFSLAFCCFSCVFSLLLSRTQIHTASFISALAPAFAKSVHRQIALGHTVQLLFKPCYMPELWVEAPFVSATWFHKGAQLLFTHILSRRQLLRLPAMARLNPEFLRLGVLTQKGAARLL